MNTAQKIVILGGENREPGSYGYWKFNKGDATGLVSVNGSGKSLTVQNGTYPPAYSANYLTLNNSVGRALLTDIADSSATPHDTVWAIVRFPELAKFRMVFGTLSSSPSDGGSPYIANTDNKLYALYRGAASSVALSDAVSVDAWYFIAVSRSYGGAGQNDTALLMGGMAEYVNTAGAAYNPSASGKIAAGSAYYAAASVGTIDFARFGVYQYSMSIGGLKKLYGRCKRDSARDGIIVI